MSPNDSLEQFAAKCTEASVGYAHASFFAGLHALDAAIDAWSRACDDTVGQSGQPKSWFRHPDQAPLAQAFENPFMSWAQMWTPQAMAGQVAMSPWWFTGPAFSSLWSNAMNTTPATLFSPMMPFSASTTVWPMTWSMMSMGVPQDVAKPTAEANAAAYDAMESSRLVAQESMAAYSKAFETSQSSIAPTTSADPNDPLALFRPWLPEQRSA